MTFIEFSFFAQLTDQAAQTEQEEGLISFQVDIDFEAESQQFHRLCYLTAVDEVTAHLVEKWGPDCFNTLSDMTISISGLSAQPR